MILVFAGQNHSPVAPGAHTFVGSCDSVAEARVGVEQWTKQQMTEWFNVLAKHHPREEAAKMAHAATYWHQIVEFNIQSGAMAVLEEVKPDWQPAHDSHELHAAREALEALERYEESHAPTVGEAEFEDYKAWRDEWKRRRERKS